MNGKARDMDYKFAIKVLSGTKVDTQSVHGNSKRYGYQNQYFYDIARNMAIQALKEKYENDKPKTTADVAPRSEWVSVEIRLPEEDIRVLVCVNSERSYTKVDTDRILDGKWVRWGTDVSHWMPLPEPPGVKEE